MRVWLIEHEGSVAAQTSLEPLLKILAQQPRGLILTGVSGLSPDLADRVRSTHPTVLLLNSVSWPQLVDATGVLSMGLPVLVAGACGNLEHWLKVAEQHPLGFVPVSAGPPEVWAALHSLLASWRREQSWRGQVQKLNQRLSDRIVIEKAKGLLMQRLGLGEEEAYKRLRVQSRRQRKQVRDIAQSILDAQFIWEGNGEADSDLGPLEMSRPRKPRPEPEPAVTPAHVVDRLETD
jgi:response regulator NasT